MLAGSGNVEISGSLPCRLLQQFDQLQFGLFGTTTTNNNRCTLGCVYLCDTDANAAGRARYDSNFAFESTHCVSFLVQIIDKAFVFLFRVFCEYLH